MFDSRALSRIFTSNKDDKVVRPGDATLLGIIYCQKMISSNSSLDYSYINLILGMVFDSVSINPHMFIEGCTLMGEILMKFHTEEVQDRFFENVLNNFKQIMAKSFDKLMVSKFENFLCSIIKKMNSSSSMLNIENFLIFIDNFQTDVKLNICNTIINQVLTDDSKKINDPYMAFVLLKITKYIHDCLLYNKKIAEPGNTIKTLLGNVETTVNLLIRKVDFGLDYETYLNFLSEVRSNIFEMESVIECLIFEVQKICYSTYRILKGKHSKKSLRFVKLCIAFCQITIPSIKSNESKIKHLLNTASIALSNNLISECDSLIKNAINILSEIYEAGFDSNEKIREFVNFIATLLSFMVVVPGNPESPFQIVQGLLNLFQNPELDNNLNNYISKLMCYFEVLKYITTQLQIKLPYHVKNVDSNDEIFINETSYQNDGLALTASITEFILEGLTVIDSKKSTLKLSHLELLSIYCYTVSESIKRFLKNSKVIKSVSSKIRELADEFSKGYIDSKGSAKAVLTRISNIKKYLDNRDA